MKTKHYLIFAVAAVAGLFVSCNNENGGTVIPAGEKASLVVTLKGAMGSRATGSPTQAQENYIDTAVIYVYNTSGIFEDSVVIARTEAGTFSRRVENLTSGTKTLVVIANLPAGVTPRLGAGSSYSDLNTSYVLDLDDQGQDPTVASYPGLTMSGVDTVELLPGDNNEATVTISRVVAKINLGTITYTPDPGYDEGVFVLDSVYIMRARAEASIGLPTVIPGADFYGGIVGTASQTDKDYLREAIALEDFSQRYFYVFPNGNTSDDATLLTFVGSFNGEKYYYPIRINDKVAASDPSNRSGKFIERNTSHTIDVVFKRPGLGTKDPETPVDPASVNVTVETQDWLLVPTQEVEW